MVMPSPANRTQLQSASMLHSFVTDTQRNVGVGAQCSGSSHAPLTIACHVVTMTHMLWL